MKIIRILALIGLISLICCKFKTKSQTKKQKQKMTVKLSHGKSNKSHLKSKDEKEDQLNAVQMVVKIKDTDKEIDTKIQATPQEVEQELEFLLAQKDDEDKNFKSQYDMRDKGFVCTNDFMSGSLYMINQIKSVDPKNDKDVIDAKLKNAKQIVDMNKVNIDMNSEKLSVSDINGQIQEIIKLSQIYPRQDDIRSLLDKYSDNRRNRLEDIKIKVINSTQIINSLDLSLNTFFCFALINEKPNTSDKQSKFNEINNKKDIGQKSIKALINYLYDNRKYQENVHNHVYYDALTLCHSDEQYVKKWVFFINREKIDCNVEYNAANLGLEESASSTTIINSGASTSSLEQIMIQQQQREEERERLRKQEIEAKQNSKKTQSQLNQEEMQRLQNELMELDQSLQQEQEYSQTNINNMISSISNMQSSVSQKSEQLKCLEKALEIRQEEENTQVISLLKDEEMHKIQSVVEQAKQQMKEKYKKRIEELQYELEKQKRSIEEQKGNYDDLMINLIKGGLKAGDKSKCVFKKSDIYDEQSKKVYKQKLEDLMSDACSEILKDQENAAEAENGLLDQLNRCTKKEMFCNECCSLQFGSDNLLKRTDCHNDCQDVIDLALQDKTTFLTDITNVIDPKQQQVMSAKWKAEEEALKANAATRFKQQSRNRYHNKK